MVLLEMRPTKTMRLRPIHRVLPMTERKPIQPVLGPGVRGDRCQTCGRYVIGDLAPLSKSGQCYECRVLMGES